MALPLQWLVITDGTTNDAGIRNQVDLLSPSGFCILEDGDWQPTIAEPKGGGVWRDSQLAEGRRPVDFKSQNVIEQMTLTVSALDQDQLIRDTQELRRLLAKARTYGTTGWQTEPVWIEARGPGETNMRYAIIYDWRTPNDGNPYEQPFWQTVARAGMNDFTLTLEREPYWRHVQPGSSECLETAGYGTYCWPCYVEYNATTTAITVPDNLAIQDLHNAAMTIEAYVRAGGWGESNAGHIIIKGLGTGWRFFASNANGLYAEIYCATNNAQTQSGTAAFSPDSEWHHVAFTWNNATYNFPRIWIDGTEYSTMLQNRNGLIQTDVGASLYIGNRNGNDRTWDGDIGWVRVSNSIRYSATFTPPARCRLPDIDGNTVGQWIGAECSGATIDNQEDTAAIDGTLANGTFDCDCLHTYGNVDEDEVVVPTCSEEVYVANKQNVANITHIFTWSFANGFSANLVGGGLPFDLIDIAGGAPANNDYVVFGINTLLADSGPFCSLVFDIGTAISGITANDWEYSTGVPGWANLPTEQDNTDQDGILGGSAFDTAGVRSVHWEPPAGWGPQVENGVTGYWVRVLVTAAPGPHVAPTQQHREVYTIAWPYLEVQAGDIGGDVTAFLQTRFRCESDRQSPPALTAWSNRLILGLRSMSRGANFTAYINWADEQNPAGLTVANVGGVSVFANNIVAPTGVCLRTLVIAGAWTVGTITINSTTAQEYVGRFHAYIRGHQNSGAAGDVTFMLRGHVGVGGTHFYESAWHPWPTTNAHQVVDLGPLAVPSDIQRPEATIYLELIYNGDGAATSDFYDLIIMPTDEWAVDCLDWENSGLGYIGARDGGAVPPSTYLNLDSVSMPKRVTSLVNEYITDDITAIWQSVTPAYPLLQANARQRLWTLSMRYPAPASLELRSEPFIAFSTWCDKIQRYYSMRGDR